MVLGLLTTRHRSYGLTRSAILAVVALVRARGRPIATPAIPPTRAVAAGHPRCSSSACLPLC
jgi:hypothetical protein